MEGTTESTRKRRGQAENTTTTETSNQRTTGSGETETKSARRKTKNELVKSNTGIETPTPTPVSVIASEPEIIDSPKKSSRKKSKDTGETTEDIKNLILAMSGIAAVAVNPVWIISEAEAENIAKPLTNILKRYDLIEKIASTSDVLSLVVALGITFVPRTIEHMKTRKSKKKTNELKEVAQIDQITENKKDDPQLHAASGTDDKRSKSNIRDGISSIKAASLEASRINR